MMNTSWGAQVVGISSAFWLDTAEGRQYGGDATAYAENMLAPHFCVVSSRLHQAAPAQGAMML